MSRMPTFLIALLASAACALPGLAAAQFVVDFNVVPSGPATCTTTGVSGNTTGTASFTLPNTVNNAYNGTSVNGGPTTVFLDTINGPFPVVIPATFFSVPLPSPTSLPYTVAASAFAAQNGLPVGIGSILTVACDTNGVGTVTVARGVPAASNAVPALPLPGLLALALSLGLLGASRLKRVASRHC